MSKCSIVVEIDEIHNTGTISEISLMQPNGIPLVGRTNLSEIYYVDKQCSTYVFRSYLKLKGKEHDLALKNIDREHKSSPPEFR